MAQTRSANRINSKHMDKHDRPYLCRYPSCAKLQGFTYSGGLLRHEREVHGKHGGPKALLVCPYDACNRHSGKGFTRKENLNEHIRRVHQSKGSQSQGVPLQRDTADVMPGAEDVETPASRFSENVDPDDPNSPMQKRRRFHQPTSERSPSEDVEDLKHEVQTLARRQRRQVEPAGGDAAPAAAIPRKRRETAGGDADAAGVDPAAAAESRSGSGVGCTDCPTMIFLC